MAIEYRGCRKLVYARVLTDTAEGMTFGEVKPLAPVQQIQREVSRSSATTYYDNVAANTITAEGAEVNNFVIAVPSDAVLADIEGKYYDPETKIYSDSPISDAQYAVGYVLGEKGDEEDEDFCWKLKGTFQIQGTEHNTENDGTDTTNITLGYTSVYPIASFEHGGKDGNGGKSKGVRIKKNDGVMNEDAFFAKVQTVDDVYTAAQA
jgi:phi13 family phage major tail protein